MNSEAKVFGIPLQGTDVAVVWDNLYLFLIWLSVFFFVLVVGGMIYLSIKYRKSAQRKSKHIEDSHLLETIWTIIPTIILLVIFAWGWDVYKTMVRAPADAMEIRVIGKQWLWNFQYDDGRVLTNEIYVPVNKPVKLVMSSEDVLHGFFIPNFRVKSDVVPGLYTSVWFEAKVPGEHQVYCTEYCGASHSLMMAKIKVLEPDQWVKWKLGQPVEVTGVKLAAESAHHESEQAAPTTLAKESLPEIGRKLTESKGCIACHSADGSTRTGPSYKGGYGKERELNNGEKVVMDDAYIRESILSPQAKVLKNYTPVMPPYQGLLKEDELNAIIAYIKSLK